jgi:hypothetical protein
MLVRAYTNVIHMNICTHMARRGGGESRWTSGGFWLCPVPESVYAYMLIHVRYYYNIWRSEDGSAWAEPATSCTVSGQLLGAILQVDTWQGIWLARESACETCVDKQCDGMH